jgi:3-methyl-2-oxobutanoate hydroxymethyltransferase
VLGYTDTTQVKFEEMLHHTRAAARGVKRALLVADLSIGTYNTPQDAVANARRLVEAGAQAVKLEGGASHVAQIEAIVQAGIPLMAHIGMLPQSVREEGGYKVKGRSAAEAEQLLADAHAVEAAGAFSVVLEIVAAETARQITAVIDIPTIGIGSGKNCDGQILVTHDLIGLYPWFTPKFISPEVHVAEEIRKAARIFIDRTRGGGITIQGIALSPSSSWTAPEPFGAAHFGSPRPLPGPNTRAGPPRPAVSFAPANLENPIALGNPTGPDSPRVWTGALGTSTFVDGRMTRVSTRELGTRPARSISWVNVISRLARRWAGGSATKLPRPGSRAIRPSSARRCMAFRAVIRLTPNSAHSSASDGNRSPGRRVAIRSRSACSIWRYCGW